MSTVGLVLPDKTGGFSTRETIQFAKLAEESSFNSAWIGEATTENGLITLGAVALQTTALTVGSAITNVFSRTPSLLGMSAATLDEISEGRAVLGVGVSSKPIVERWHGLEYERSLRRLRETIEILHSSFQGSQLDYSGEVFDIGPWDIEYEPVGDSIPIYNAAMGPANCRLTGEFADGWLPAFVPLDAIPERIEYVEEGAKVANRDPATIQYAPLVGTAVSEDPDEAESAVRSFLAQKLGTGYNRLVRDFGYGETADEIFSLWNEEDEEGAAEAVTEQMLAEFTIHGTPEQCIEQVKSYYEAGVDEMILFPPFSASSDLIRKTIRTFDPDK
jgi:alkanesulfonate monooxygenase SsuD/methylene tetrahydromethanopterin reductase-like flavin-dependent oxidoreductase (luciferase family)